MRYLAVKTQNKRGNKPIYKENLGYVSTFLRHPEDRITVDNFDGCGDTYKKREMTLIEIYENGNLIFSGNKYELFNKLKK